MYELDRKEQSVRVKNQKEPALELHSGAAPTVEAHHRVNGPDIGRNSGGRRIKKIPLFYTFGR